MLSLLFSFILCLSSFLSYFGETVLKKTDFICFGRVEDVSRFQQNIEVGRLELKELVWTRSDFVPPAFTEKINVMGNYLGLQPQEEYLFFLKKLESRQTFKVIGKISKKTDEFFAVKYQNIRLLVELETLDSLEERKERLKVFFLENLVHSDRWVRENASTELSHFLQHSPRFLNQRDINQIKKAYFFTSDPVQKEKLKQFLQFLQKQNPQSDTELSLKSLEESHSSQKSTFTDLSPEERTLWIQHRILDLNKVLLFPQSSEDRNQAWRELIQFPIAFLENVLLEFLTVEDPDLVERSSRELAKRATPSAIPRLLQVVQNPSLGVSPQALAHLALALGRLQAKEALPFLRSKLNEPKETLSSYLTALALYFSEETQTHLLDFRDQQSLHHQNEEWIPLIRYLLSKEFKESQRKNQENTALLEEKRSKKFFPETPSLETPPKESSSTGEEKEEEKREKNLSEEGKEEEDPLEHSPESWSLEDFEDQ